MAKSNAKKANKSPLFIALISIALVAGVGAYIANSPARSVGDQAHVAKLGKNENVKTYTPSYKDGDLKLTPKETESKPKEDPRVFAVNEFLGQLKMVPKGARAVSCKVSDGLASLDFSNEFETTYGTEDEQTVVKGILTTMSQFKDVKKVKLTVSGRTLDSLGNIDLTAPQDVLPESASGSEAQQ